MWKYNSNVVVYLILLSSSIADSDNPTIEIGLFLDEPAYNSFAVVFDNDENKIREMLITYMNGVQSLFHRPSLQYKIDLRIVHLEIFYEQPEMIQNHKNYSIDLLRQFCDYQDSINPSIDSDTRHWDLALLLTGFNFHILRGDVVKDISGLSYGPSMCTQRACAMTEFGILSMGFNYVSMMAHEIGHTLGIRHDGDGNNCESNQFIMTTAHTQWSNCSIEYLDKYLPKYPCLNDNQVGSEFHDNFPGRNWSVKKQCEVFFP